ncbi:MAG: hypothetical protein IT204_16565 [Fimbriimonadaceae bacterium]|nr:hypothetical protein [Fimbriimonadaceae bacterium]
MPHSLPPCRVDDHGVTRRERVLEALHHRQPDRCPHEMHFTQHSRQKMAAWYDDPHWASRIGNHFAVAGPALRWTEPRPGYAEDAFGVVWNRTVDKDIGIVDRYQLSAPSLAGYTFPDVHHPALYQHLPAALAPCGHLFRQANLGFSLFERAWTLRGMDNLLMDMVLYPEFVHELLDAICDWNVACVHELAKYDFDCIGFGDDWGQQRGLITGPKLWHEFIGPRVQRMYDAVHEHDMWVWIHSCGDIAELFGDLIEKGVDCFNPFQPEAQDVAEAKRLHGDRLSFHGGVSLQQTLSFGTPDDVRAEAEARIRVIGRDGGYILAPCHAVTGDVPAENIHALLEVALGQYA